jgi:amylosucrase
VLFKAEAIVGPQDLLAYLGTGRHHGKVSDLAYHNSLMVQVWSMLAAKDVRLASHALRQLPVAPSSTSWITYARCHDDIGWAISDEDAAAVGLGGPEHRRFLSDFYSGDFPGTWARGLVFQENPATGDRRISGSLASLAGLEAQDPHAVARILLVHAIILGFGGIPVLWMGDELGLLNDHTWATEPGHADDNRWVHRPTMPWSETTSEGGTTVQAGLRHLTAVRKDLPHLHGSLTAQVLDPRDPGVLLLLRGHPLGPMLGAYNVTPEPAAVPSEVLHGIGLDEHAVDRLTGHRLGQQGSELTLPPYVAAWLISPEAPAAGVAQ